MKTLGLIFRSLYKNDVCVEAGRKYAWWAALLIFLFSTIVSIIPITTTTLTVDGGSILTGANYELDESLYRFISDLNQGELLFEDDENGINTLTSNVGNAYNVPIYERSGTFTENETGDDGSSEIVTSEKKVIFQVYDLTVFPNYKEKDENENVTMPSFTDVVNLIVTGATLPDNYVDIIPTYEENKDKQNRDTSFLALGKYNYAVYLYDSNGNLKAATSGDYVRLTISDLSNISALSEASSDNIRENVLSGWQMFFRFGYEGIKLSSAGIQISISLGVNSGMILIMSLILFVMTRGKKNPFKVYKYYEFLKICCWIALSPAILALILGYLLPSTFGMFSFILVYGVRGMFLSIKQFRPQY